MLIVEACLQKAKKLLQSWHLLLRECMAQRNEAPLNMLINASFLNSTEFNISL